MQLPLQFTPKLFSIFKEGYSKQTFVADLLAGIVVAIVALPLAIAFAIASGVKPEQGLYTAIIPAFFIAILGGSRAQISGPTGAFIVVILSIVQQFGYSGLATATFIAGFLLVIAGVSGMGVMLKFIPYPVIVGFTSGISVIILTSQIKDLLGLHIVSLPGEFIEKWQTYFVNINTINIYSLIIGGITISILIISPKMSSRIPGSLVAVLVATLLTYILNLPIETIGSKYGEVPNSLPLPQLPDLSLKLIREVFPSAITIALLGGIESLLSAVVADGMMGTRHRSNIELIAQGVGNIVSPLFSGIPATGAIARTATNIKNGGKTPISAVIHCITLLLIMLFLGSWAAFIPLAVLAGILIFVAYNMGEWHTFYRIFSNPRSDILILITTFLLTVLIDLTVAIEVGVILSAFSFLKRMESTFGINSLSNIDEEINDGEKGGSTYNYNVPPDVELFEVCGPLFYAAVDRFNRAIERLERPPKALILRLKHVPFIDGSGINAIESLEKKLSKKGTKLLLAGLQQQPRDALSKAGILDVLTEQRIFKNTKEALDSKYVIS